MLANNKPKTSYLFLTWTRSAFEALRNALYKFETYLLTYLSVLMFVLKVDYVT